MRRFESTPFLRLRTPAGRCLDAWVAESLAARLLGLAFAAGLPEGRALLLPRCRSVHTVAMRFPIDIAFVTWPPAPGCEIVAVETGVPRCASWRRAGCLEARWPRWRHLRWRGSASRQGLG